MEFRVEDDPDPLEIGFLETQIRREASAAMGIGDEVELAIFVREAGKVVAGISAPQFPEHKITDITKAGQVVTLKASADYSGPLTAYSGPVTMVLTLRPKGPDLAAWFDFNNSGFQIGGTAKKKS